MLLDVAQACRSKQFAYRVRVVVAVLQPESAAGPQVSWRRGDDPPDGIQSICTARQCPARLKAQIFGSEMRIAFRDVGRIAYNQVKLFPI
jgi:hypothetical protein